MPLARAAQFQQIERKARGLQERDLEVQAGRRDVSEP